MFVFSTLFSLDGFLFSSIKIEFKKVKKQTIGLNTRNNSVPAKRFIVQYIFTTQTWD